MKDVGGESKEKGYNSLKKVNMKQWERKIIKEQVRGRGDKTQKMRV